MSNVLTEEERQQAIALGRLGHPSAGRMGPPAAGKTGRRGAPRACRRCNPGQRGVSRSADVSKPANEVTPDSGPPKVPRRSPTASVCQPYLDFIELSLSKGRNAKAIWQDLVDDHGFHGG